MNFTCNETFLRDIVRIDVYDVNDSKFSLPSTLPNISDLVATSLGTPLLSVTYDESGTLAKDGSMGVKQSLKQDGSTILYIYNVECSLENSESLPAEVRQSLMKNEHNVVLTTTNKESLLLYSLPGTFSADISDNMKETSLKLNLSSVNDFVKLNLG